MATIVTPEDSLAEEEDVPPGPFKAKLSSSDELSSDGECGKQLGGGGGLVTKLEPKPQVNGGEDIVGTLTHNDDVIVNAAIKKLEAIVVVDADDDDVPVNCDLVEENLYLGE